MRHFTFLGYAFILLVTSASQLPAQGPWFLVTPANNSTLHTVTPTFEIKWCDELSLSPETMSIKVNDVEVSWQFDHQDNWNAWWDCPGAAGITSTGVVNLQWGYNEVYLRICDGPGSTDNCSQDWYWYQATEPVPPIMTLNAPASPVYTATTDIAVSWCDNFQLYSDTRWIKVNGVPQTTTYSSPGSATCSGTWKGYSTVSGAALNVGNNTIAAHICDTPSMNCTDSTWTINRQPDKPLVDVSPHNYDKQDYGRCLNSCFAGTYSYSTVPYYTAGQARSLTLSYNSDRVSPRPFVHLNVKPVAVSGATFQELQLWGKVNGTKVTWINGDTIMRFTATPGTWVRIGGQLKAATYAPTTGVYDLELHVLSKYNVGTADSTFTTKLTVVNDENSSGIAKGWTLSGIPRVYFQTDGSALITEGDGSATYFKKNGSTFVTPPGDFSRFETGPSSRFLRWYPDSTKVTFFSNGLIERIDDRFANATTFGFDGSSRLISYVPWPLVKILNLFYGANGLDSIGDPGGRKTKFRVNATTKVLEKIVDPDGDSTKFTYDSTFRMASVKNRLDKTTDIVYALVSAKQTSKLDSVMSPTVSVYPATSARLVADYAAWQLKGVPFASTNPTPFASVLVDSVVGIARDPGGHRARFTVNRFGQPLVKTEPLGTTTTVTYSASGLPVASYDSNGLPTRVRPAGQQETTYQYGIGWGVPSTILSPGKPAVQNFLGLQGRLDSTRIGGPGGKLTKYTYSMYGEVLTVRERANTLVVQHWYDSTAGTRNVVKDSTGWPNPKSYTYDATGRLTGTTQLGSTTLQNTVYDVMNRPVRIYNTSNPADSVAYAYNDLYLTQVKDAKLQLYQYAYNDVGWVTARRDPASGKWDSLRYDKDGLVKRMKNRRGAAADTLLFTYDSLHRKLTKAGAKTAAESWSYSSNGRVITGTSPVATHTDYLNFLGQADSARTIVNGVTYWRRHLYNQTNQVDSIWGSGYANYTGIKYFYDAATAKLDTIRLGGAITRLAYDAEGRWTSTHFPGGESVTEILSDWDGTTSITASNGNYSGAVNRKIQYNTSGKVGLQFGDGGTGPGAAYQYSTTWQRLTRADSVETVGCQYIDNWYGWACDDTIVVSSKSYAYDILGNRTDYVNPPGPGYTPSTSSRLTSARFIDGANTTICSYAYDADGNDTLRACTLNAVTTTVRFRWSAENRLDSILVNGQLTRLEYDAFNRLVKRTVAGVASYFVWDGASLVAEVDGAGAKIAEYSYYGIDQLHAIIIGAARYYAHTDALGNVTALTDEAKFSKRTYVFDPWGRLVGGSDGLPFSGKDRVRFKGALWMGSQVDLYYMRNRWYDPVAGRFLSEDPIGLAGGMNPYAFVDDDPINGSDPSGLIIDVDEKCTLSVKCMSRNGPLLYDGDTWSTFMDLNPWRDRNALRTALRHALDDELSACGGYWEDLRTRMLAVALQEKSETFQKEYIGIVTVNSGKKTPFELPETEYTRPDRHSTATDRLPFGTVFKFHTHWDKSLNEGPSQPDRDEARRLGRRGISVGAITWLRFYQLNIRGTGYANSCSR
jgi:RHS repeat-associated protein